MSRHTSARRQLATIRLHNLQRHFPVAFQTVPLADSIDDHSDIGDAVIRGDAEAAEQAMRTHLDRVVTLLRRFRDSRS